MNVFCIILIYNIKTQTYNSNLYFVQTLHKHTQRVCVCIVHVWTLSMTLTLCRIQKGKFVWFYCKILLLIIDTERSMMYNREMHIC